MKCLFFIAANLLIWAALPAQNRPVGIKEVIELSLAHSAQVQKAQLDISATEAQLKLQKSAALPQIGATAKLDAYPVLPTQFLPGDVFAGNNGTYIPLSFGQPWQLTGSVYAEQILYTEAGRRMLPAAEHTRNLGNLLLERNREEVAFQTATIFYQYLQTRELLRSVAANTEKLTALQRMAELQLKNGYLTPLEVKRIKVARTNLEQQHLNLLTGLSSLRETLQFLCGVGYDAPFEPSEDITAFVAGDSARWLAMPEQTDQTIEWRLLNQQSRLIETQEHAAKGENWPAIALYSNAWLQQQSENPNFFNPNNRWYGMVNVGLKVQAPIFDGFRAKRKSSLLKINQQKIASDLAQLQSAKTLEFRQAKAQLRASLSGLRTQTDNVALATEVTDKLNLQYKEGVVPLTDLLNAQTARSEAEAFYWQQVFAYKLAVLKLAKAAGVLTQVWQ